MTNENKIDTIIERLEYYDSKSKKLPRVALQNAIDEQEAITPYLLQSIKESTIGIERVYHDPNYMLYFYALFLLSQFREKKAFPLMIDFFSADAEMVDAVLDDFITESGPRALASTYDGNLDLLKGLIENKEADEFVRASAKDSVTILYLEGILSREEVIEYYRSLLVNRSFDDNDFLYSSLVNICSRLSADELKTEIQDVFQSNLIDPMFIDLESYQESLNVSHDEAFQKLKKDKHYSLIDDTIGELSTWAAFRKEKPLSINISKGQPIKAKKKIGRNELCPCDSGKKYKKCCIKKGIY